MQRAIAYIRVSTDRQAKDGTSLVTQKRHVLEYATFKSYHLVRQFMEEGESAKTDDRPVLQEMLQFCKQNRGRIDVLIFPKIDRFARYAADYHFLKGYLRDLGIRIESIDERFDDSPAGRFLESMLAATAQFDNDVRSERTFNGMKEAVSQGRWVWQAPRGYRNVRIGNKATIEPDPRTAPLIQKCFTQLASGQARPIDTRKWLAEQGLVVSRSQFYRMIINKVYIGVIEAFGLQQQGAPPYLPLVSESTFLKAKEAFRIRRGPRTYQIDHPEFPLRGTLRCECGKVLTACWAKGRTERYAYYRCRSCPRVNLSRDAVEESFSRLLRSIRQRYALTPQVQEILLMAWQEDQALRTTRRSTLEKEIRKIEELQKALALKNAEGVLPDGLAREQIEELETKRMVLRTQFLDLGTDEPNIRPVLDHARRFLASLPQFWRKSDIAVKKHLLRFLLPHGATVEIHSHIRTAKMEPATGSAAAPRLELSHMVAPMHEMPNRQSRNRKRLARELLEFYRQLFREFGEPA